MYSAAANGQDSTSADDWAAVTAATLSPQDKSTLQQQSPLLDTRAAMPVAPKPNPWQAAQNKDEWAAVVAAATTPATPTPPSPDDWAAVAARIPQKDAIAQKPSAPPTTAFEAMLVQVYQNNPRLNSERLALKMADEKVSQANAGFRPNLSGELATGRQREKVGDASWIYGDVDSQSLVATQPLFAGFGTLEQKRAAEARVLAERAHLLSIEQNILFTAISDWMMLYEKEHVLALNKQNVDQLSYYNEATRDRYKLGDGTQTDIAQSASRLAIAQARYAQALAERDSARATFLRDTGIQAQSSDLPPLPTNLPHSREDVETLALSNPAMLQAAQEQEATEHDIGTAESSLWPKVFLRGSISEDRSPSLGLDRLRDDSITLNVSVPLYQGGGEYSRVREAKLAHAKTREDAIDTQRSVVERADVSWDNYQAASTVVSASQRALEASTKALDGVEEEQRQGLRTLTEMLDEQSEHVTAQISHIEAQRNLRLESYRLMASVGQLTIEGLHLQTDAYDPVEHHDDVAGQWFGL